jgi:hypothetical protein
LLLDRDEISNLYRGPSIDASCQVLVHLAKPFQRRFLEIDQSEICFLPNFDSFGEEVSEIFLEINQSETIIACGVSGWPISKNKSPLKLSSQMNRNLFGSTYGRFLHNVSSKQNER